MSTQEESNLIVFVTEEYSYLCYVMILQGTSLEQIKEWWQEKKGYYNDPLPGEVRRSDILWKRDLNPEAGWTPVEETWPQVNDVFHLLDRKAHTYDPTEYVIVKGAVFVHVHMEEDSYLRLPDGTEIPHPNADPHEDDEDTGEVNIQAGSMMAWGATTSQTPHFPTFNNARTGDGGTK